MRWLIIGALEVEIRPLLWQLKNVQTIGPNLKQGLHPDDPNTEVAVLRCGIGPTKAGVRSTTALPLINPDAVVSIGTCGALIDSLSIGDICSIRSTQRDVGPPETIPTLGIFSPRALTTVVAPCWTASKRAELAASGAEVVEMEAAAVRDAVRDFNPKLQTYVLKVVSDQAGAQPDPVVGAGTLKRPLQIARFKYRALQLSRNKLVPALLPLLVSTG